MRISKAHPVFPVSFSTYITSGRLFDCLAALLIYPPHPLFLSFLQLLVPFSGFFWGIIIGCCSVAFTVLVQRMLMINYLQWENLKTNNSLYFMKFTDQSMGRVSRATPLGWYISFIKPFVFIDSLIYRISKWAATGALETKCVR